MPSLIDDFERWSARVPLAGAERLVGGDIDADNEGDLLVLGDAPSWRLTRGALAPAGEDGPHYRAVAINPAGPGPFPAGALLDADHDGDLDLVLASTAQDRVLIGDGWGKFLDATAGGLPVDWVAGRAVAAADMDLDGTLDLVFGNDGATDRLYVGLGDGRFKDATLSFGFDSKSAAAVVVADFDGDGADDVASLAPSGAEGPWVRMAVAP